MNPKMLAICSLEDDLPYGIPQHCQFNPLTFSRSMALDRRFLINWLTFAAVKSDRLARHHKR
jgi:hypothetical protein